MCYWGATLLVFSELLLLGVDFHLKSSSTSFCQIALASIIFSASALNSQYIVNRTRFHNFPIYLESHSGGNRKMTVIKYVEGDIWVSYNTATAEYQ